MLGVTKKNKKNKPDIVLKIELCPIHKEYYENLVKIQGSGDNHKIMLFELLKLIPKCLECKWKVE